MFPRVELFCAKSSGEKRLDSLDKLVDGVKRDLAQQRDRLSAWSHPTRADFVARIAAFASERIQMAQLAGHGTPDGFVWWPSSSGRNETLPKADFVRALAGERRSPTRSLELVFLDGCHMQDIAHDLHAAGLPYILYWEGRVEDDLSIAFSKNLYKMLKTMLPGEWGSVVKHSWRATKEEQMSSTLEGTLCLLWNDPQRSDLQPKALDLNWTSEHGDRSTEPIR